MTTIPISSEHGIAGNASETFDIPYLITGKPPTAGFTEPVAAAAIASADLLAFTVVGRNGSGQIVPAVHGSVQAIGITTNLVPEATANAKVTVFFDGVFNPDALVWDASYDTDEKKRLAFEGAGANIFLVKPQYQGA